MTEETTTPEPTTKRPRRAPAAPEPTPEPEPLETLGLPLEDGLLILPDGRRMAPTEFHRRLALLTSPFGADQIEKLPKQVDKVGDYLDCKAGTRASADGIFCGGRHRRSVHLDYVGHAGVTMRLDEVDALWDWDFLIKDEHGRGVYNIDGMWITLTVLGITHKGFGSASGKSGGDAIKELIGDALRNASMRFGIATYLWSKSDESKILKAGGAIDEAPAPQPQRQAQQPRRAAAARPAADKESAPQNGTHEPEPAQQSGGPEQSRLVDEIRTAIVNATDRLELGVERDTVLRALWERAEAAGVAGAVVYVPAPWHGVAGAETVTLSTLIKGGRIITIDSGEDIEDDEPRAADMSDDPWATPAPDDTEGA